MISSILAAGVITMDDKNNFALVRRPPSAIEKSQPGAKRILSGMVADTLSLAKKAPLLKVVVVDDEEWRLEMVEMNIRFYFDGITVQTFQASNEGWQELLPKDPDLLITDDIMGKFNGEDIVRRLADRRVAYPIIVISGWDGPETEQWVSEYSGGALNVTLVQILAPSFPENLVRALESGLKISRKTIGKPVEIATHHER